MRVTKIVIAPIVTEKAQAGVSADNKYSFLVAARATKNQIKTEIEKIFGVRVLSVKTGVYRKVVRTGPAKLRQSRVSRLKKAIIKLGEKDKIELLQVKKASGPEGLRPGGKTKNEKT